MAVIKDGVDAVGGSYVFVQRWEHTKQLNRMRSRSEMMIGRTKEAFNEEIDGDARPATSHLSRVDLKEERQRAEDCASESSHTAPASGTMVSISALTAHACTISNSCASEHVHDTDGKRDAMLRFTKPVTGGYHFAPSLDRLLAL